MTQRFGLGLRANITRVLNAFTPATPVALTKPVVAPVKSSTVAKERLAIILAHQRSAGALQDMLSGVDINTLQAELLACVKVRVDFILFCFISLIFISFSYLALLQF